MKSVIIPEFLSEFKKVKKGRTLIFLALLFLGLLFFVYDGISDYKSTANSVIDFQKIEIEKVKLYIHYTLYGVRGVRLMFLPHPISALFNDSGAFNELTAAIDTAERLQISTNLSGKGLFSDSGGFMDFSGILFLCCAAISLTYGCFFARGDYRKYLASNGRLSWLKIMIAKAACWSVILLVFWGGAFCAILFSVDSAFNITLSAHVFTFLAVQIFLFIVGGFVGAAVEGNLRQLSTISTIFFLSVFLLPWMIQKIVYSSASDISSNQKFGHEKLKLIMKLEKALFKRFKVWDSSGIAPDEIKKAVNEALANEFDDLKKMEEERKRQTIRKINWHQFLSALFPTAFYSSMSKEVGSMGHLNYVDFFDYAHAMKYGFLAFYTEKKFDNPYPGQVEPFINGNENIFKGQSRLPKYFALGLGLTLLGTLLFLYLTYRQHKQRFRAGEFITPEIEFPEGENSQFVLCKNKDIQQTIFQYYLLQPHTVCLEQINPDDFRLGLNPLNLTKHLCRLSGVPLEKTLKNLEFLEVNQLPDELTDEMIKKIHIAVSTAGNFELLVLDHFLEDESKKLEKNLFHLLAHLDVRGKYILYLSTEMYNPAPKLEEKYKPDGPYFTDDMNYKEISVR